MSNRSDSPGAGLIAVVPAAGVASRLPRLSSSKEMLPVRTCRDHGTDSPEVEPVICHLLRSVRHVGAGQTRIVLRAGKWDIPDYLSGRDWDDLNLCYIVTSGTSGVPQTVAVGLRDCPEADVVFGFPDILFEPVTAFATLVDRLRGGAADVVLGAFPTQNPGKMDMLETRPDGRVIAIDIKPHRTSLEYTWILAAWKPDFTRYFLDIDRNAPERIERQAGPGGDLHLGHSLQLAIRDGLRIEAETFTNGRSLDIGTPDDLGKAPDWFSRDGAA